MEASRLALRFRDVLSETDTIEEHRKIIAEVGYVFWGWWRKHYEESHTSLINKLKTQTGYVKIIDTSTKRCFVAKFSKVVEQKDSDEIKYFAIPSYYREQANEVKTWFVFTSIDVIEYEIDLARRIGNNTIYVFDEPSTIIDRSSNIAASHSTKNSILQLSDLHFGSDHGFANLSQSETYDYRKKTLGTCLLKDLRLEKLDKDIGAIVITGDITTRGDWTPEQKDLIERELQDICDKLKLSISKDVYFVPGNHDIVRQKKVQAPEQSPTKLNIGWEQEEPFRVFISRLQGKAVKDPLNYVTEIRLKECDIQLCLLNSCAIAAIDEWTEYGYVGQDGEDTLEELGEMKVKRPTYRMMALHHHLLQVNPVELLNVKGISLTIDAIRLLDLAAEMKVSIALHGHQHAARIANYTNVQKSILKKRDDHNICIISGGSSGVKSERRADSMSNAYSVLTFKGGNPRLLVKELNSDGVTGHVVFDYHMEIEPLLKST